ncbi:MAG: glycosyltransferase family 2 protein [Candidatus Pacearchaeota archaeon]|nr:glycosyltransferase family 2 protein [Candidatus Pacearchaeota archaeon]
MVKKLSIIVPVYNEEKTLSQIIVKLQDLKIKDIKKEIIIVNDASTDKSKEIIKLLIKEYKNINYIEHKKNLGKGSALRAGFKKASGDYIVIQDGDLEYDPEDFKNLIVPLQKNKADVVYGSRMLGKITGFQIKSHYYGNKFLSFLTMILYGQKITDMETCYKMMSQKVIKSLNLNANKFDIEPEITAKILKKGYKLLEIPITYNSRSFVEGKKITWKDGLKALYVLCKYRIFD